MEPGGKSQLLIGAIDFHIQLLTLQMADYFDMMLNHVTELWHGLIVSRSLQSVCVLRPGTEDENPYFHPSGDARSWSKTLSLYIRIWLLATARITLAEKHPTCGPRPYKTSSICRRLHFWYRG